MRTYHKEYGCTASITDNADGTARLIIKAGSKKVHDKNHKSRNAAMAAWYRYNK